MRNRPMRLRAAMLAATLPAAAAAQTAQFEGNVTTATGMPLQAYPVIIQGQTMAGDEVSTFVTTDVEGRFRVFELPPGTYSAAPAGEPGSAAEFAVGTRGLRFLFLPEPAQDTAPGRGRLTVGTE